MRGQASTLDRHDPLVVRVPCPDDVGVGQVDGHPRGLDGATSDWAAAAVPVMHVHHDAAANDLPAVALAHEESHPVRVAARIGLAFTWPAMTQRLD